MQLSDAPIYTPVMNKDGTMSTVWIQWFALVQTLINRAGQNTTTAPIQGVGATFTGHYGSETNALGEPTAWLSINNLKVPGY